MREMMRQRELGPNFHGPIDGYSEFGEALDTPDGMAPEAEEPGIDIGPAPDMRRPMPLPEYGEGPPRNALTQQYKGFVPGSFGYQPKPKLPRSNTPGGAGMFGSQQGGSAFPY